MAKYRICHKHAKVAAIAQRTEKITVAPACDRAAGDALTKKDQPGRIGHAQARQFCQTTLMGVQKSVALRRIQMATIAQLALQLIHHTEQRQVYFGDAATHALIQHAGHILGGELGLFFVTLAAVTDRIKGPQHQSAIEQQQDQQQFDPKALV